MKAALKLGSFAVLSNYLEVRKLYDRRIAVST
jgi:hypothetical protein